MDFDAVVQRALHLMLARGLGWEDPLWDSVIFEEQGLLSGTLEPLQA